MLYARLQPGLFFAPLSIPVVEGSFLLISFNASSKGGEKKVSFLSACQSGIPAGWALLPSQRRRCQPPRGEAAGLTAPSSFIARRQEKNYFYHLLSLLPASPPVRRDGRGIKQSFYPDPEMCFEFLRPVLPPSRLRAPCVRRGAVAVLPGDVSGLCSSRHAPSRIDPSCPCLSLSVPVIYQAGLEMGMWCLSLSLTLFSILGEAP